MKPTKAEQAQAEQAQAEQAQAEQAQAEQAQAEQAQSVFEVLNNVKRLTLRPYILPGTSGGVGVSLTGVMGVDQWIILGPNSAFYSNTNPQGWAVTAPSSTPTTVTVSVPSNAPSGTAYEVRWRGRAVNYGYERYSGTFPVP